MSRRICIVVAVAVMLASAGAAADPAPGDAGTNDAPADSGPDDAPPAPEPAPSEFLHIRSSSHLVTDGGSDLRLDPGYYLTELKYAALDAEMKRLQNSEVRLTAENQSLRSSAESWQPGWKTLLVVLGIGLAGGVYVGMKL